jgi:YHS domain-containing protein
MIAGRDDNIRTIEQDRFKITQERQPDGSYKEIARSPLDAPKEAKEPTLPNLAQEYEYAVSKGYKGKFEDWKKLSIDARLAAEMPLKTQESEYKYGTPQQSFSVTAGGKTYYFKDQNSANLFRQKAGIK